MAEKINIINAVKLTVLFIREGSTVVAHSPALDLSSCGKNIEEAKKGFEEALTLFIEECIRHNTLDAALESLGWERQQPSGEWAPPEVVGQLTVPMPAMPTCN